MRGALLCGRAALVDGAMLAPLRPPCGTPSPPPSRSPCLSTHQMELRVLAHLSADAVLTDLLRQTAADPFHLIAAAWVESGVDPSLGDRENAKHIVYGAWAGAALAVSVWCGV